MGEEKKFIYSLRVKLTLLTNDTLKLNIYPICHPIQPFEKTTVPSPLLHVYDPKASADIL